MTSYQPIKSGVFIVHTREFHTRGQLVFKIGKCKNIFERIRGFPKAQMYTVRPCFDCNKSKRKLLNVFKEKFIHRTDIGYDYFEGNPISMLDLIDDIE